MVIFKNEKLHNEVKNIADKIYKKNSAYKSGFIIKKYKELGGQFINNDNEKPLKRWFNEQWQDIGNKDYPVYRPTKKINNKTPLLVSEIDKKDLINKINLKQKIKGNKNLSPFKKK